ncbi:MAG: Lrp/AsnC family transcriptional regulator [Pseudomonadota bacterium]
MDATDVKILALLQADATLSIAEVAERVNLSPTPCWRRIQTLESQGVLRGRVALLDADSINVGVTVFVRLRTQNHDAEWLETFADGVSKIDEVIEFHRLSGDIDYLLKIVVPDIGGYDAVYKRLIAVAEFSDVSANFVMETIKGTTALPLSYADLGR